MKSKLLLFILGGLPLFFSASVPAHISSSGEGLSGFFLHPFTGLDHILMMIFIGISIAYLVRKQREQDD